MPGSPLAQTSGKFQQQKLVAAVFPGLNQQVLAFLGISTFISLGLADDSLHPSEGLQKIRFPPPLYSVLHEAVEENGFSVIPQDVYKRQG